MHIFWVYLVKAGQQQKVISEGQGWMFNEHKKGLIASVAKATPSRCDEQGVQGQCGSHTPDSAMALLGTSFSLGTGYQRTISTQSELGQEDAGSTWS